MEILAPHQRYLFTWECGAGIGHLARYQQLIELLLDRGDKVMFASKNLEAAERVYGHLPVNLIQAPIHLRNQTSMITPVSYVDVLINQGFEFPSGLKARAKAWLRLIEMWQPAVIIADHSPTVLLAQRLYQRAACIVAGNGFCIPPIVHPFPLFTPQVPNAHEVLIQREQELLEGVINPVLEDLGGQPMAQCQQLFSPHTPWLFGLAELDHYVGQREQAYLGTSPSMHGELPSWPNTPGPRVFVYLKAHTKVPYILKVLTVLKALQWPVLIYGPDWSDRMRQAAQGPTIQFSARSLDLQSVGGSCQLAVTNGGINSVTELLCHGTPQLLIPLHVEQSMFCRAAKKTGACLAVAPGRIDTKQIRHDLEALADPQGANKIAAIKFSRKHGDNKTAVRAVDLLKHLDAIIDAP